MNNFTIGMHGSFDINKFKRDFKEEFYGIEACEFVSEEEVNVLWEYSKQYNFKIGVHFPLLKDTYKLRDPLLLSLDKNEREEAYEALERGIIQAKNIDAEYILIHFPKPVILNDKVDWSSWRFGSRAEYIYESQYDFGTLKTNCKDMFQRLTLLSNKFGIVIVLEFDALSKHIYKDESFEELFKNYPLIKVCLDTGRLHILSRLDKEFDVKSFIKKMAPYSFNIHLWNEQIGAANRISHYPALPEQREVEGWGDVGEYLKIITSINHNVKIMFEHRSYLISDVELENCYTWVDGYFKNQYAVKE